MRHTFVVSHGIRVEIQQSKIEAGAVLLSINYPGGDRFGCATIPAATAALIAQALEIEAAVAEAEAAVEANVAQCCEAPRADCMGMLVPSIGDGCRALREDLGALETLYDNRGKYGGAIVLSGRVLPVLDLPQTDTPAAAVVRDVVDGLDNDLHAQFFSRRASDCGAEKVGA